MATQSRFTINGVIDTSKTALQNLEDICNSCGGWLTFDNYSGKWSVVINQPGSSIKTFDHSNIIGGIRMNGTGLEDLYNAVKVTYPLNDIQNNTDFIEIALPEAEWNPNEVKNVLDITLPLVNNQVQARLIGFRDLKQNRVNQIIQFETDYSSIGLKAGDIITVTSEPIGLSAELYRISEIREQDSAELGITLTITAILYSADVYDENNLNQYILTTENGIITAGDIGTPLQPTVTSYQSAARPRLVINTVVPSGVISAMEFWLTTGNASNTYNLVGTQTNTSGVFLTEGSTVTLDISNQDTGNVYVKTRAVNSTSAGAFSPVSALIPFVPGQVTEWNQSQRLGLAIVVEQIDQPVWFW
jgi:predicted phage tail protein